MSLVGSYLQSGIRFFCSTHQYRRRIISPVWRDVFGESRPSPRPTVSEAEAQFPGHATSSHRTPTMIHAIILSSAVVEVADVLSFRSISHRRNDDHDRLH